MSEVRHVKLEVIPICISKAAKACLVLHRHHAPPQGGLFSVGCRVVGESCLCGVAIVGRPVSRALDDGFSVEVLRLATDGTLNACSFLYGQAWRSAKALGYRRLYTYTLGSEDGASCRAANLILDKEACGGREWGCRTRPRSYFGQYPVVKKNRWYYGPDDYQKPQPVEIPPPDGERKQLSFLPLLLDTRPLIEEGK